VNADDLGISQDVTDAALAAFARGEISVASAAVYLDDSERAASLAARAEIPVGLHPNLTLPCSRLKRARSGAVGQGRYLVDVAVFEAAGFFGADLTSPSLWQPVRPRLVASTSVAIMSTAGLRMEILPKVGTIVLGNLAH
jgi:hypothetical protein